MQYDTDQYGRSTEEATCELYVQREESREMV